MMLYEKNIKTLAKYYPRIDELIEDAKKTLEPELEIYEEEAVDGEVILKIKKDGRTCYLNGKRNTTEPAQKWVEHLGELQTNAHIFMMGVGNAVYLKELVEKTTRRVAVFVYEPSVQIFLKFLELVDIERWMEKHTIVFWVKGLQGMDEDNMKNMLSQMIKYENLVFSRNFILPNYDVLFAKEAVEFVKICRDIANVETIMYNTRRQFSSVMVKNLLSNALYLCKGYKTTQLVEVIPRDIPGILVAAGPSLNKNIRELKRAKGKAFIIAVDTAIKPLLKEGIVPDMYVTIDAMKPLDLVKLEEGREIPLITNLNAASEVLRYHTGMKFFFNEGYQFAERIFLKSEQKIGPLSTGGSVANTAFSLLYKIGMGTVILVGQDLAYTNNKSHADGTFQDVMKEEDTSHFLMVEGNYEEKVPTRYDFKHYLDWYNEYIAGCQKYSKGFRVINATEGGAKINNTEIMTLKEAIDRECTKEVNIGECLSKLSPMLNEENQRWAMEYLKGLSQEFHVLASDARKLKNLYRKLDKISGRQNIDKKEYLNLLKKLEKSINNMEGKSTYQLVTITMNNAQYILSNEQFLQEDSMQKEGKEIARKGILYTENVGKMAKLFQEVSEEIFCT